MKFLKDVLGDDLYNQVSEKLKGHEKDIKIANLASGDYVSKAKYDADLQTRDTRITELADQVKSFDGVDVNKLQADVKDWKDKYDKDLKSERLHSQVQLAVAKFGARSEKALMGMLDLDKLTLDDNGDVKGMGEQIETIKKENAFLFTPDPVPAKDVDLGGGHGAPAPTKEIESIADYYGK